MHIIDIMKETNKSYENFILWQPVKEGIRIVRVYGKDPCLCLPECIDGIPVTEIGPYCFSATLPKASGPLYYSQPVSAMSRNIEAGGRLSCALEDLETQRYPLCGNVIMSVRLPDRVTTLHNGVFYNCRTMTKLSAGSAIRGIGSDCFTNNRRFNQLLLRTSPASAQSLKLLLERLAQDLTVSFVDREEQLTCSLYFPEYYEWLDEIFPAHIFSRTINGAGFRMRKCFQGSRLDFEKYDLCFTSALREESDETICRICLCRLISPLDLKDRYRVSYEAALRERLSAALTFSIEKRNPDTISWICRTFTPDKKVLSQARGLCLDKGWSEGASLLMELSAGARHAKRFEFDSF